MFIRFDLQVCVLVPGQRCTKKLSDIQTSHMIHVSGQYNFETRLLFVVSFTYACRRQLVMPPTENMR